MYQTPANKVSRMRKYTLDKVRKRLDRIRREQADIYSHFKKRYDRKRFDMLLTKQDIRDLYDHDTAVAHINTSLTRAISGGHRSF